jgi:hypothetical protein
VTVKVYVPTGQFRRPSEGEYFYHPDWGLQFDIVHGVDGRPLVMCYVPGGCPSDGEIYEAVEIQRNDL